MRSSSQPSARWNWRCRWSPKNAINGEIWVDSTPGKGSCFHFTATLGVSSESRQVSNLGEAISLAGIRVVVVDDNLTNRRILADMLWGWGMQPAPAASGPEALAHMRRAQRRGEPFNLVLTDVHMPEMDGFELVKQIHDSPEMTKSVILMLTSSERGDDFARCRELGVSAYLTKPVRRAELRAAIARALGDRQVHERERAPRSPITLSAVQDENTSPGARILLVEDNAVNQRVALRLLEKQGHKVVIAGNGREALRVLAEQAFDLVLMDVQMPEMDGFEATAAIRKKEVITGERLAIVAMTAHAMTGDRERCLAAGMDGYLSKPIDSQELRKLVDGYRKQLVHRQVLSFRYHGNMAAPKSRSAA